MTLTADLSQLGLGTESLAIPQTAMAAAGKMLLDALGCAVGGVDAPGISAVVEQIRYWGGRGEATVFVTGDRLPAPNAAFANSAMIHALDYDDIHIPGSLHITSIVVPAALAAAEVAQSSGRDFVAAIVMGVETAGRLGMAYQKRRSGVQGSGFLPSSIVGGFGAVVAAARLLGLSVDQCVNAMGINYAQAAGNRQALHDKSLTKRLQPAFAVRSAMWALDLARRGITGPDEALEGSAGLFAVYQNAEPPTTDELLASRERYEIERLTVKRYTSCGACHTAQQAAERLAREEDLAPDQIANVEIYGIGPGGLVGNAFEFGDNPQVNAQFSVQYAVAYALLRGQMTLEAFRSESIRADKQVAELAQRIRFTTQLPVSPPPAKPQPDFPAHTVVYHAVIVHTRDGRVLQRGGYPVDTLDPHGVTQNDVVGKFRDCAAFSKVCQPDRADRIITTVNSLSDAADTTSLLDALVLR